jgi:pimeloyl-ACP methyl ester carboxylesterase
VCAALVAAGHPDTVVEFPAGTRTAADAAVAVGCAISVRPSQIRASAAETALMIPGAVGLAEHYPELTIPVAVVAGLGDKIVDCDRQAGRLGAELPQSMLRKVPDAGHMIHHIVPEQVAAVILDVARAAFGRDREGVTAAA